jgi:hypothetical protein
MPLVPYRHKACSTQWLARAKSNRQPGLKVIAPPSEMGNRNDRTPSPQGGQGGPSHARKMGCREGCDNGAPLAVADPSERADLHIFGQHIFGRRDRVTERDGEAAIPADRPARRQCERRRRGRRFPMDEPSAAPWHDAAAREGQAGTEPALGKR